MQLLAGVGLVVVHKLPSDHSYWVLTNTRLLCHTHLAFATNGIVASEGLQIKIGRPLRSSLTIQFSVIDSSCSDNIFDINLLLITR